VEIIPLYLTPSFLLASRNYTHYSTNTQKCHSVPDG